MQLSPPELRDTPNAPGEAADRLAAMGPMSRDERWMAATMVGALVLWVLGDQLGVTPVVTAMLGLCTLLGVGVLSWTDCLKYSQVCRMWFCVTSLHVWCTGTA